jgi:hypothetical protein
MPEAITLSQLESHLWEAANILRGLVDAADFKIARGDILRSSALFTGDNLSNLDCFIANALRDSA